MFSADQRTKHETQAPYAITILRIFPGILKRDYSHLREGYPCCLNDTSRPLGLIETHPPVFLRKIYGLRKAKTLTQKQDCVQSSFFFLLANGAIISSKWHVKLLRAKPHIHTWMLLWL